MFLLEVHKKTLIPGNIKGGGGGLIFGGAYIRRFTVHPFISLWPEIRFTGKHDRAPTEIATAGSHRAEIGFYYIPGVLCQRPQANSRLSAALRETLVEFP